MLAWRVFIRLFIVVEITAKTERTAWKKLKKDSESEFGLKLTQAHAISGWLGKLAVGKLANWHFSLLQL